MSAPARVCPACGSRQWKTFLEITTGRSLGSDQRIVPWGLQKLICARCGVACNHGRFSAQELELLYGRDYQLNTCGEDHLFFTPQGPVPRSQVYLEWIEPFLPRDLESLLEVGCGQGNLLSRLARARPHARARGLEGSRRACEMARARGLDVKQGLILSADDRLPASQAIVSVGVLEHMEEPGLLAGAVRRALTPEGRAIFCLPVQDHPGYDLFFSDHVWHLTMNQWRAALAGWGLEVIHAESDHPINQGFGLFVCRKAEPRHAAPGPDQGRLVTRNRDHWLAVFKRVDGLLAGLDDASLAVFGAGEVFSLFMAYTRLGEARVLACLDEDSSKHGSHKHGVPIVGLDRLKRGDVQAVLLAVNPKYHRMLAEKLAPFGLPILSYAEEV